MPADAGEDASVKYECDIKYTACGHVNDGVYCGPDVYEVGDDASYWIKCSDCGSKYTHATVVAVRKINDD